MAGAVSAISFAIPANYISTPRVATSHQRVVASREQRQLRLVSRKIHIGEIVLLRYFPLAALPRSLLYFSCSTGEQ